MMSSRTEIIENHSDSHALCVRQDGESRERTKKCVLSKTKDLLGFTTRRTEIQPAVIVGLGRRWNIKIC